MTLYLDNSLSIGNTPMVKLNHVLPEAKNLFAKLESRNPAGSVKCRIGANMIWAAEKKGLLQKHSHLIEATSGNTGIALAFVAASRGHHLTLTMPETMSIERRQLLKGFGVNLVLTAGEKGMRGAIEKVEELYHATPEHYIRVNQFSNPANPEIHFTTTGPELWRDTKQQTDIIICGVGTGGTISGVSRYIKQFKQIITVAVEPQESPVISQALQNKELQPGLHKIQGIGAGFIPENLDMTQIDEVCQVNSDEAFDYAKRLMREEGVLAGISCGAVIAATKKCLIKHPEWCKKNIAVILPDSGERYLSTALYN